MTRQSMAVGIVLYAIAALLLILLLGPIGVGIAAVMGFLLIVGLLSSLSRK